MHPKIAEVIEYDVCTACGACAAVCPVKAVNVNTKAEIRDPNDMTLYVKGAAPEVCEECYACSRVCPVVHGYLEDEFANVKRFFAAKSDIPGQDGGVTSAILKSLFEKNEIDCVVGISRDENWQTELILMTKPEDVDKTTGTKYTYDSVVSALREPFEKFDRIAVVGVPCQIHGSRLIMDNINDKIVLLVGLFCMESFYHDVMTEEIIPEKLGLSISEVIKLDFAKGKFWAYTRDGESHNVPIPEIAPLARDPCHACCDYTAIYADISVGSVGAPDGWNSVLIRTEAGERYFDMVEGLEIMEDPKPGMSLIKKLTDMKHSNNVEHYLEVCEKFSFEDAGIY
ncbi:coenzyme F420 hydrogenase/dehydrogenase beta subunit domain protein [Methanosalsum zhilinae DSM 4017]|uniref:Coenzyme F420 hydrogenase/dehydrogenase beta subunit domain protein n=1 Tax=Methanosalsum zhilinae (strain DSM 4017 / NBRC 107636 / OCM 62 / WeN5) TaxID=679901 RepID=F7XN91_METZD|nr:F420H2 dehydrogenase subunit FpoF [Methanosalsum zhilinae]AEH60049.1 coenzyme F420 hydrogenase/dehydrogenase beta subunit domain protein [Methanosalsum zhilinae DSM 4017]